MLRASGMSVRARQTRSKESSAALLLGAYLSLSATQCTFPEYDREGSGTSGAGATASSGASPTGASGGSSATGGGGGTLALGGTASDPSGGAAGENAAPDPECDPEQWPVARCADTCLRRFPDHCYDGDQSGDESDVDCGGSCQGCTTGRCDGEEDCLRGTCVAGGPDARTCSAPLVLGYTPHETAVSVATTAWSLTLTNQEPEGGSAYAFKDLKIRYYFQRSGVTEPILTNGTQSNLKLASGESRAVAGTWTIVREEGRPEQAYDAYMEVGFAEPGQLFPGDRLELYQQLISGDPASSNFDQRANYSFLATAGASERVVVRYQDKVIWGLEPRPSHPRACFGRAVNVSGPALTVEGNAWQSASQAGISTTGASVNQEEGTTFFPAVTGALARALDTYTRLNADQQLMLPVENDTYLVYLYAISPSNDASPRSHFTLQGEEPESSGGFKAQPAGGGQAWAKMGPYRLLVTNGELVIGVSSGSPSFNIAALELWYPE